MLAQGLLFGVTSHKRICEESDVNDILLNASADSFKTKKTNSVLCKYTKALSDFPANSYTFHSIQYSRELLEEIVHQNVKRQSENVLR